jgi:hypothetical protein
VAEIKDKPLNLTSYHSKLVGVTFEGRQDTIKLLNGDEQLRFRREPENEYDPNAVAVDALVYIGDIPNQNALDEWVPIGYIAKDKNSELAEVLMDGRHASIKLNEVTGGGDKSYGVNVNIEYERKRRTDRTPNAKLVKDFFGNEGFYDDVLHEYTNSLGVVYTSASEYSSDDDFDGDHWAEYAVNAYGLPQEAKQEILDMWEVNGNASRAFGTALHAAIQLYGEYHKLADVIDIDLKTGKRKKLSAKVEKNSALSKLPYLQKVAKSFFTPERLEEVAYYEVLVFDHKNQRAGRIDRLVVYPDGSFAIRDMKTNNKLTAKDKRAYQKQLSFYGDLILANGGVLAPNPIAIHHWTEEDWEDIKLEKIDTLSPEVDDTPELLSGGSLSRQ